MKCSSKTQCLYLKINSSAMKYKGKYNSYTIKKVVIVHERLLFVYTLLKLLLIK